MNDSSKLLLWIAAASASAKDLRAFFRWAQEQGPERATDAIERIRSVAADGDDAAYSSNLPHLGGPKTAKSRNEDQRINEHIAMIETVERLLLKEAKLSKADATRLLMAELKDTPSEYGYLSSPNKISFRSWLARLGEDVSDSTVLHVASRIRNELVHGRRSVSAWPI